MNTNKLYDKITNLIIEMLENHKQSNYTESWISLTGDSIFAKNAISNHVYNGINQLLLNYLKQKYKYVFNSWMTFKQLSELGGRIKKGSKASLVVYKSALYLDKQTGKNITKLVEHLIKNNQSIEHLNYTKRGYMRSYSVFNINQIDNLPDNYYKFNELENLSEFERDETAEHIIKNTGANIECSPQNTAYYSPKEDKIYLPERRQFKSKEDFMNVAAHELGHFSGHPTRLNRPLNNKHASKEFAFEELIAEINAAFLCAYLGYENKITDNVDYIDSWLSVMKNDKQFIVQASSQAQKACDYILSFSDIKEAVA